MIPDVPTVLNGVVRTIAMEIAPEVKSAYGTLTVQLGSALLMMIAQEFDRAASRLVEENRALAELFRDARRTVQDARLRAELEAHAGHAESSLLVSELQRRNRSMRDLLICLHAHVEELDSADARALDDRIWSELAASTRRRHLDLAVA